MARIRTIKPEFSMSQSLGRVSREARLCFILLITQMDDHGRLAGTSRSLARLLYPFDTDVEEAKFDGWCAELQRQNCIIRYSDAEGHEYIASVKWAIHQKVDRPSNSKIPPPPDRKPREVSRDPREERTKDREGPPQDLRTKDLDQDQGSKDLEKRTPPTPQGGGRDLKVGDAQPRNQPPPVAAEATQTPAKPAVAKAPPKKKPKPAPANEDPIGFDVFWKIYPRHVDRKRAVAAYQSALNRQAEVEDIIRGAQAYAAERIGEDPTFTKHPTTWLNGDCWLNAPTAKQATDLEAEIKSIGRKLFPNGGCDRHLRNLELTFPNNLAERLKLLKVAEAAPPSPMKFLNRWMWDHGPEGIDAGDIS